MVSELHTLLLACAPLVAPATAAALVHTESGGNPQAIGVVDGHLVRQPRNKAEALVTARSLQAQGIDYSVGLAQINRRNFARLGLTLDSAFEPCANLTAMQAVLGECFERARVRQSNPSIPPAPSNEQASQQTALRMALSCYYSGNFQRGFRDGYVQRVLAAWRERRGEQPYAGPTGTPPVAAGRSNFPTHRPAGQALHIFTTRAQQGEPS
jgi:type IV secretion system protein VirB1